MSNFTGILTPTTPPYTVSSGFDAVLYDAQGSQHILVRQGASLSLLGASGANRVTLDGNAAQWQVRHDGSTAIFTRGSDTVRIPALTEGQVIVFSDRTEELRIDTAGGAPAIKLGTQILTYSATVVGGGGGNTPDPVPGDPGPGSTQKAPWTLVMGSYSFGYGAFLSDGSQEGSGLIDGFNGSGNILSNPDKTRALVSSLGMVYGTDGSKVGTHNLNIDSYYNEVVTSLGNYFITPSAVTDGTPDSTEKLPFRIDRDVIVDRANMAAWVWMDFPSYGKELTRIHLDNDGEIKVDLVLDINPGADGSSGFFGALLPDGRLVFSANDGVHGNEPWVSDGTEAGTFLLKDLYISPYIGSYPMQFTSFGDEVVFAGSFYDGVDFLGRELIVSDGTQAGTRVIDVYVGGSSSDPEIIGVAGDLLYFSATDAAGRGIFRSDGVSFERVVSGTGSGRLLAWTSDKAFFRAADSTHGDELWVANFQDGTFALVRDFLPGSGAGLVDDYRFPAQLLGNNLIFTAYTSATQQELFISDGTDAGTVSVATGVPLAHAIAGDTLFFADNSGVKAVKAAGSPTAVSLTQGVIPGNPNSGTSFQIQVDADQAFYALGGKLYASNGSTAGTVEIASNVQQFKVVAENAIYLIDNDRGLWYSDGTANGTRFVDTLSFEISRYEMASAVGLKTIGMWDGDVLLP